MATRYNITSTVQRVVSGNLTPGSSASALITDPAGTPITVYVAETGGSTVTNPVTTSAFGRIEGWVATPDYNVTVSGVGITTYTEYIRGTPQGAVAVEGSTAINWGTGYGVSDTNLYRASANILKTDDYFYSAQQIEAFSGTAGVTRLGSDGATAAVIFGADVNLYRQSANVLATDDTLYVGGGGLVLSNSGTGAIVQRGATAGTTQVAAFRIPADTQDRFLWDANGLMKWGPGGSTAVDTTLYRNGVGSLITDGAFTVGGGAGIGTNLTIGGALDHNGTTVGFFGIAPATRQAATTDIKDALTTYGLLQGTSASPLNLDGGALTASTVNATTGFQVNGVGLASTMLTDTADLVRVGGGATSSSLTVTGNSRLGDADTDTVGFFSSAGTTRASATADIKDALTAYGLLQGTSATPLNLDGGALTAGAISGTTGSFSGAVSGTTGTFSGNVQMDSALDHNGSTVGFYARTPTAINATPFTNSSGLGTSTYALPANYTIDDLAAFVLTALKHLGDTNGVGLLNTTTI